MKVKELIAELQLLDPETDVMIASDQEGNSFSEWVSLERGIFNEDTFYSLEWTARESGLEEDEWLDMKARQQCVVIWP